MFFVCAVHKKITYDKKGHLRISFLYVIELRTIKLCCCSFSSFFIILLRPYSNTGDAKENFPSLCCLYENFSRTKRFKGRICTTYTRTDNRNHIEARLAFALRIWFSFLISCVKKLEEKSEKSLLHQFSFPFLTVE